MLVLLVFTCCQSHAVQVAELERDVDACGQDVGGRDAGQVAEGEAVDDVGGCGSGGSGRKG